MGRRTQVRYCQFEERGECTTCSFRSEWIQEHSMAAGLDPLEVPPEGLWS